MSGDYDERRDTEMLDDQRPLIHTLAPRQIQGEPGERGGVPHDRNRNSHLKIEEHHSYREGVATVAAQISRWV